MANNNDMVFWDEMWNTSKKSKKECCGDWDAEGICRCGKTKNYGHITKDSVEDTQMEP